MRTIKDYKKPSSGLNRPNIARDRTVAFAKDKLKQSLEFKGPRRVPKLKARKLKFTPQANEFYDRGGRWIL